MAFTPNCKEDKELVKLEWTGGHGTSVKLWNCL